MGENKIQERLQNDTRNSSDEEAATASNEGLSGWADSMSKILRSTKPKAKKNIILSRAKKDYEIKKQDLLSLNEAKQKPTKQTLKRKRPKVDFEIVPKDSHPAHPDTIKVVKPDLDTPATPSTSKVTESEKPNASEDPNKDLVSLKAELRLQRKQRKLQKEWETLSRAKVTDYDKDSEKALRQVATRGVVQLFNAVSIQQKTLQTKLKENEHSEFKKDDILKGTKQVFDSAMKKAKKLATQDTGDVEIKEEIKSEEDSEEEKKPLKRKSKSTKDKSKPSSKKPAWVALQDNYMMDASLKDWDRDSD